MQINSELNSKPITYTDCVIKPTNDLGVSLNNHCKLSGFVFVIRQKFEAVPLEIEIVPETVSYSRDVKNVFVTSSSRSVL